MNNDLISREALKEALHNFFGGKVIDEPTYMLRDVFCFIDSAPTVEPCYQTTSCLDCKNYDKETHNCPRYCEVIKEAIKSRPQGEWVRKEDLIHYIASDTNQLIILMTVLCEIEDK